MDIQKNHKEHMLKTDPAVFQDVLDGSKTFEIRFNDRGYQIGDLIVLKETKFTGQQMKSGQPLAYTGREIQKRISYVLGGYGLQDDWVILGVQDIEAAKAQAVPEGFVLVPTENVKFFSHDFNGGGFQYHDTLLEAKKASEADLDIYRDRVADGNHIADMGEFNELAYGIVVGQAEWSVDCVVSADDHKNGEYTQYGIGTEILSLYLSEAQEQSHE